MISRYYQSLQRQLSAYFDRNVSVYAILPDGNCLYRALFHLIFGTEIHFGILKHNLISKFTTSPQHHINVMKTSGILNDQDLQRHVLTASAPNEWGTNVELNMLGAFNGIDVLYVSCTNASLTNWNILPYYPHNHLDIPVESEPIFESQKLCLLHHRLNRVEGNEHFDTFYFD